MIEINNIDCMEYMSQLADKSIDFTLTDIPYFRYPIYSGKKRIHPTQKHPELFKELILDNTNDGDLVFDPCAGGMTTALACSEINRNCICCELSEEFYNDGIDMLKKEGILIWI